VTVWDVGQNPSTRRHFEPRIVQPVSCCLVFFSGLFYCFSFSSFGPPFLHRPPLRIPQTLSVISFFRLEQHLSHQHMVPPKERRPCLTRKPARERRRKRRRRRRASPRQRSLRDKPIKGHTSKIKRSKGKKGGRGRGRSFLVEEQARNQ